METGKKLSSVVDISNRNDFARQFDVSRETMDRLQIYADLLQQWQKAVNLVAKSTIADIWMRHMADSAQLYYMAPEVGSWVDLGSGAGFPGLVVAILRAEHGLSGVTLIESDRRKCAFLHEVRRNTGIAVDIVEERIEMSATQDRVGQVDIVSARALASLPKLFSLASPLLKPDGTCLFLKGRTVDEECRQALQHWSFQCGLVSSITDDAAHIAVVKRLEAKLEG